MLAPRNTEPAIHICRGALSNWLQLSLQCNLAFKKLTINPIVMSAGELESGNAGEPAKLIRQRYREASDIIKKGKLCSLFINDLDAGAPSCLYVPSLMSLCLIFLTQWPHHNITECRCGRISILTQAHSLTTLSVFFP